jgi:hypothetical protein
MDRTLAAGKGSPGIDDAFRRRDHMATEPVRHGEIVEIEGQYELLASSSPTSTPGHRRSGGARRRRARGAEAASSAATTALDWLRTEEAGRLVAARRGS